MYTPSHGTHGAGDTADRTAQMRAIHTKEQDLQILRNELREAKGKLEDAERAVRDLETALSHNERDIQTTRHEIRDLNASKDRVTTEARASDMNARELHDSLAAKRQELYHLDREVAEAKRLFDEKDRARAALHMEVLKLERDEQLAKQQAGMAGASARSGGGNLAQKEEIVTRLESEHRRKEQELDTKKREVEKWKQKVTRIEPEERGLTHELEQMR